MKFRRSDAKYRVRLAKLTIRAPGDSLEASISVATNQNFPPFTRRPAFQSVQPLWASDAYSFTNDNDRLVAVFPWLLGEVFANAAEHNGVG